MAVLLYDGSCGPCSTFARLVEAADVGGRIETRTLEDREVVRCYQRRLGARYSESFHLDTGGRLSSGAEAIPELLGLLPGGRWWAPLARAPLLRAALSWGYARMSRARLYSRCAP